MSNCKSACTPLEVNQKLSKNTNLSEAEGRFPYRELMGCLMYLAVATRPDIAHAVSALGQFNECYGPEHWAAAKRILRYLKGTMTLGLMYKNDATPLFGYADADWGNCAEDRRSYSGYSFILGGAVVSWESRKQRTVALSSTEAEYMSLAEATKEAIYLRKYLLELGFGFSLEIKLYCDNQGALKLAENPIFHNRTKHVDIKHHFVRDALRNKLLKLEYISTSEMVADVLTKSLPGPSHRKCTDRLGLEEVFLSKPPSRSEGKCWNGRRSVSLRD
ncbi:Copia protein [Anthophora quadrimaculata]